MSTLQIALGKNNSNKRNLLIILTLMVLVQLSGCVGTEEHDTLHIQAGYHNIYLDCAGFLGRLAPGETIYTMPGLAINWTHNPNRTEWTVTLREGYTMHDGSIINAKAVQYSFHAGWLRYKATKAVPVYMNLSEAVDDSGINITFPASDPNGEGNTVIFSGSYFPDAMFEWDISGAWEIMQIIPYGAYGLYSDTVDRCQELRISWEENPIGSGPYRFVEAKAYDYVLLERFDDWYGWGKTFTATNGESYTYPSVSKAFKNIRYRADMEEATAPYFELLTGGLDVAFTIPSRTTLERINNMAGFSSYAVNITGGTQMKLNIQGDWPTVFGGVGNYPLSEMWFRQALSHALNRTNLIKNVFLGIGQAWRTFFPNWILEK